MQEDARGRQRMQEDLSIRAPQNPIQSYSIL